MTGLLRMANTASPTQISISAAPVGDITVQPTKNLFGGYIDFTDSTGRRFGRIYTTNQTTGEHGISLQLFTPNDTANTSITLLQNNAGQARVVIPTPAAASDTNDAATTAWVRDLMASGGSGYMIESSVNGTSWYQRFSNGWVRQGGYVDNARTITLLRTMANTDYSFIATHTAVRSGGYSVGVSNKTTTSLSIVCGYGDQGGNGTLTGYWVVEGQEA